MKHGQKLGGTIRGLILFFGVYISASGPLHAGNPPDPVLRAAVEADWIAQLTRAGQTVGSAEGIRQSIARIERLADALPHLANPPDLGAWGSEWDRLRKSGEQLEGLPLQDRRALHLELRWAGRRLALMHPRLQGRPLVFMKRHRFVCQMLHEYLGYFHDYGEIEGGGVFVLTAPGESMEIRDLSGDRLGRGNYTTLAVSPDARTLYFAFAERAPRKPDFYSAERKGFHLYAMNADGTGLRQLTSGPYDDFDPCPLPDGALVFMSTRRGGFGRCHNEWEPLPAYTLHRMEADGGGIRTLSWHETNEWHPWVLNEGRIVYSRWDYVDRSAANFHGLWISNPDGSNPVALFGNYTMEINACYQPRAIPDSERLVFVAGAHHADVGGALVLLDPCRVRRDPQSGADTMDAIEVLTPEVVFPESAGWPSSYYHSPWPLSEDAFVVAYSPERLPGMSSGEKRDTPTGLYYFDRFGNLELLYRDPEISCMYPIPLASRPTPPALASALDAALGDEGEFLLTDVQQSHFPLPEDRSVHELRVFQVLPKTGSHVANRPRLGHANAESARMLLGTVPVETDGSAYFRAPSRKPLYFQAVDAEGRAVQSMRSITYLQPGERAGCIGCHEPVGSTAGARPPLAAKRPPSRIEPGPEGSKPLGFPRLVQPVLDRYCVSCHDGATGPGKAAPALTGEAVDDFSRAYVNLKPFVRWYEWGDASISQIATHPGQGGADASPLSRILADATHRVLPLTDQDRRRLYLWLDANVPFYGTYENEARIAQQQAQAVPPPTLQ